MIVMWLGLAYAARLLGICCETRKGAQLYRAAGRSDGPAVLLLHGFPWSSRMWQPLIDRLADRYRMVAPDYPGFGHNDAPPADSFECTADPSASAWQPVDPRPSRRHSRRRRRLVRVFARRAGLR